MKNKFLIDTHVFLWATSKAYGKERLSKQAMEVMEKTETELFVSSVSLFEITNKFRTGKLPEYKPIAEDCKKALEGLEAKELPLNWEQAQLAGSLDWTHKDPFDRMLAAQAQAEDMTLITCDKVFDGVTSVEKLW